MTELQRKIDELTWFGKLKNTDLFLLDLGSFHLFDWLYKTVEKWVYSHYIYIRSTTQLVFQIQI